MIDRARQVVRRTGLRRTHVGSARACCERNLLALGPRRPARTRILCYHSIGTPQWGINDVPLPRFQRQIEVALELGYGFVPAADIAAGTAPERSLAITFDDGLASVMNAAPLLADYGIPWSLFIVTAWADDPNAFGERLFLDWRELEAAAARNPGLELGSHSMTHPRFSRLGPEQAAAELAGARDVLRQRLGIPATSFAIPLGQSGDWSAEAARLATEAGYERVYAQSEERRAPGTIARTFVTRWDNDRVFRAALGGRFDRWEEWI